MHSTSQWVGRPNRAALTFPEHGNFLGTRFGLLRVSHTGRPEGAAESDDHPLPIHGRPVPHHRLRHVPLPPQLSSLTRGLRLATLWLPVVAYGALVFYLSSLSHVRMAKAIPDYLEHAIEYLGLTVLTIRALNEGLVLPIRGVLHFSALGLGMLYALSDEIHQIWVPRRTASLKDFLSDTLGGVLAVGLAELIQRTR